MTSEPEDDETKTAPAEPTLPSVIVDADLLQEAQSRQSDPAAQAAEPTSATDAAPTDAMETTASGESKSSALELERLSSFEADRFAASIRPSWEPPAPVGAALRFSSMPPAPTSSPALASGESDEDAESIPPTVYPPRVGKTAGFFVAAGCILGFGALLVYAIAGGETKRPESWGTNVPAPVAHETTEHAAAAPAAPPAAPAAPAAAPTAPTTATALPPPPPAPAAAEPAQVAPAPTAATPPPAPAIVKVRVRVSTTPRSAQLRLDGTRVGNPYSATVAQSGPHVFEARASGYQTRTRSVTFDRDQVVQLALDKVPSAAPRPPTRSTAPAASSKKHLTAKPAPKRTSSTPRKGAGFVADSPY